MNTKKIGRPKKAEDAKKIKISFYIDSTIVESLKRDIEEGKATNLPTRSTSLYTVIIGLKPPSTPEN